MEKTSNVSSSLIIGAINILIGIFLILIPRFIFPICEYVGKHVTTVAGTQIPMKCFYMAKAEYIMAILIVIASLLLIFSKSLEAKRELYLIISASAIFVILIPTTFIGVCLSREMSCKIGTKPTLVLLGCMLLLSNLFGLILTIKQKKKL